MTLNDNLYIIQEQPSGNSFKLRMLPESIIYEAHFPGMPITPGVCIIQIAKELLERVYGKPLRLKEVVNAKYLATIEPGKTGVLQVDFSKLTVNEEEHTLKVSAVISSDGIIYTKLSLILEACND